MSSLRPPSPAPSPCCRICGPHPSRTLPSLPHRHFFDSDHAGNWFLRRGPAERARCTRVCPRGCRLAVSWESRRVCTLVLEAVTLPCIAVLVNRTSRVHLTSPAQPPTRLYIDIVAHRGHVCEHHHVAGSIIFCADGTQDGG